MEKTCPAGKRVTRLPDWSYGGRAKVFINFLTKRGEPFRVILLARSIVIDDT